MLVLYTPLSHTLLSPSTYSIVMWDPPEGYNPTQGLELLQKKVELLGGNSLGSWCIECETLQSTQTLSKRGVSLTVRWDTFMWTSV